MQELIQRRTRRRRAFAFGEAVVSRMISNVTLPILKLGPASHNQNPPASYAEAGGFLVRKNFTTAVAQEGMRFVGVIRMRLRALHLFEIPKAGAA